MSRFEYPPVGFRFSVNFHGSSQQIDASFSEVSGISAQLTTEEIIEGGENRFKHRLPLQMSYTPLVLKRGVVTAKSDLFDWIKKSFANGLNAEKRAIELQNLDLNLLDDSNNKLITWTFIGAYPIKFDISGLKADSNQLAIETIELSYQRFF
jgi:phage tail-like protein